MYKFIRQVILVVSLVCFIKVAHAQSSFHSVIQDRDKKPVAGAEVSVVNKGTKTITDSSGNFTIDAIAGDSIQITKEDYTTVTVAATPQPFIEINKAFQWHDLINPQFYIEMGGLWLLLFVIFAETGLFAGFFLPGDSLLFVAGIYSNDLAAQLIPPDSEIGNLLLLWVLISVAGIIGNMVGYWFGKKSGPFLYQRKDTFLFKKKYLIKATDFYNQYGGWAIVAARFVPIIRTFAPIVAGVVNMDKKKFIYFNIVGCFAWVAAMLFAGHFLYKWVMNQFGVDLKEHLEMIVILIVLVSTIPVVVKFLGGKKETDLPNT